MPISLQLPLHTPPLSGTNFILFIQAWVYLEEVDPGEAGRLGAGTFGRRRLSKQNPWRMVVIECKCYYRNALFSSIQLLFYASAFSSRENLLINNYLH